MSSIYDDTDLTADERRFLAQAESGKHYGEYGKNIGSAIGGATAFIPVVGPAVSAVATPILSQIGNLIGSDIGGKQTQRAEQQLALSQDFRNKKEIEQAERMGAVKQLLGQWTPYL